MKLKKIVRCGAMAALLALSMVVVAGCQQQHAVEDPDTKLMQDAVDSGKEPVNSIDTPFYVLIVGNGARTGTTEASSEMYADGKGRSDTMMLVRIDPKTYQVSLVTIPRDTETTIDGGVAKINEAYHVGGIDMAIDQVEKPDRRSRPVLSRHGLCRLRELRQRAWRGHGERPHRHAFEGHRERRHH